MAILLESNFHTKKKQLSAKVLQDAIIEAYQCPRFGPTHFDHRYQVVPQVAHTAKP